MSPRFDPGQGTLRVSVTELLEVCPDGSANGGPGPAFGFGGPPRGGRERQWLGQALHARYQALALASDASFRGEVSLSRTLRQEISAPHRHESPGPVRRRDLEITLSGRADGVRRGEDGRLRVEEIKTTRSEHRVPAAVRSLHALQVAIYAWMLTAQEGEPVAAELVWLELGGTTLRREPVELSADEVERAVRRRLITLCRAFEARQVLRAARRVAAATLAFPHATLRPGQDRIVAAVETSLAAGEHLLLEASTGIGKTAGVLHPALRFALIEDKRVFVLTSKNTQQEMSLRVLEALGLGREAPAVGLRSKAAMCANEQLLCREEYCRFARDYARKLAESDLLDRLLARSPVLRPDQVREAALQAEVCPFETSLELSRRAVVTVCDYHHAVDPWGRLSQLGEQSELPDTILVIDEAHNLVDRARDALGASLAAHTLERALAAAAAGGAPIHRELHRSLADLAGLLAEIRDDATGGFSPDEFACEHEMPVERFTKALAVLETAFFVYLEYRLETFSLEAGDAIADAYFATRRFVDSLGASDEGFASCVAIESGELRLRVICLDAARHLHRLFSRCHSVIGLSATLSPLEFHRDRMGLDPDRTVAIRVPSPFPAENRRVVIDARLDTRIKQRSRQAAPIARRLCDLTRTLPGCCLALFPSFAFLEEVARELSREDLRVLKQRSSDGDQERQELLAALGDPELGQALVLAVSGGALAEGVDTRGGGLKAVAVLGPCPPPPDLERELLRRRYDECFDQGFEYAYVIPGMTRVVQAAGRLLRSEEDTGVLALMGRRFLKEPYRSLLPEEWLGMGAPEDLEGDAAKCAAEFFGARPSTPARPPRG